MVQASKHPFVTGEPFTCPYMPAPETSRVVSSIRYFIKYITLLLIFC